MQRYEHAAGGASSVALAELKAGRPTRVISAAGHVRDYEYGANHQAQFIRHSDQTLEAFCYNDLGQITRQRDRLGRVTRTTYDARGNLLTRAFGLKDSATNVPAGASGSSGGSAHGGGGSGSGGSSGHAGSGGNYDPHSGSGSTAGHNSSGSGSSGSTTADYNPCATADSDPLRQRLSRQGIDLDLPTPQEPPPSTAARRSPAAPLPPPPEDRTHPQWAAKLPTAGRPLQISR